MTLKYYFVFKEIHCNRKSLSPHFNFKIYKIPLKYILFCIDFWGEVQVVY